MPDIRRPLFATLLCMAGSVRAQGIAESGDFTIDTRDYGGSLVTESGDFTVDTITEGGSGPWVSGVLTVDTRAATPDMSVVESAVFTVDTRPYQNALPLVLSGRVRTAAGVGVPGAVVTLQLYGSPQEQVVSRGDGAYQTPAMTPRSYTLNVRAPGWQPQTWNLTDGWRGGAQSRDFLLLPNPVWLTQDSNGRQPTLQEAPPLPDPAATPASGFGSPEWLTSWPDALSRDTVVLTHGMKASPAAWPRAMGQLILQNVSGTAPNVLVWDWNRVADRWVPIPIVEAACQGPVLGRELQRYLGVTYGRRIHFIGHSLGTIVNSRACDYLHGGGPSRFPQATVRWNAGLTMPHMTLLDHAEIANPFGTNVIGGSELASRIALASTLTPDAQSAAVLTALESLRVTTRDWKSALPKHAAWTDNYISLVGWTHEEAVNACLFVPPEQLVQAHSYAWQWYRDSITLGTASPLGWHRAHESGALLPPGDPYLPGRLWLQSVGPNRNPMSLVRNPLPLPGDCNIYIAGAITFSLGYNRGAALYQNAQATVQYVQDIGAAAIRTTGQVLSEVRDRIGQGLDAGMDKLAGWGQSLIPDFNITDSLHFTTTGLILRAPNRNLRDGDDEAPSAWVTLQIPANAGLMAFDFTVIGDPAEDAVACAVGGTNLFNLPASFVEDGETQSTDYMDISAYAGQTVEVFFGLTGGTSSNCELQIEGLRFVTIPLPPLVLEDHGATVSLHWPTAASGWYLEASDSLATGSWQEVLPNPGALTAENGITRLEEAKSPGRQFYRLRRRDQAP